jgi:hypothetical protein
MAKPENQLQLKNGFGELGNIFAPKRYQNWWNFGQKRSNFRAFRIFKQQKLCFFL